jgi:UDP-N-acetylglucosamine 2-epimerase (non-hydrolysing)
VAKTVNRLLRDHPRIELVEPMDYLQFIAAMRACSLIVTDSGGIQEEAPFLGKPVLVVRAVTERPEAIESGVAYLAGTREEDVYNAIVALLNDPDRYSQMARTRSPFGDGYATRRILAEIRRFAGLPVIETVAPLAPLA